MVDEKKVARAKEAIDSLYDDYLNVACTKEVINHTVRTLCTSLVDVILDLVKEELSEEDRKKFRIFLEIEFGDILIEMNEDELNESLKYKKMEYVSQWLEELKIYDDVVDEIWKNLEKINFTVDVPDEKLIKAYEDFKAGKDPSICDEDEDYRELYKAKIKAECEEKVNISIELK